VRSGFRGNGSARGVPCLRTRRTGAGQAAPAAQREAVPAAGARAVSSARAALELPAGQAGRRAQASSPARPRRGEWCRPAAAQAAGSAPAGTAHELQHGEQAVGPASQVRSMPAFTREGGSPAQ
jgi:hypothetical protein